MPVFAATQNNACHPVACQEITQIGNVLRLSDPADRDGGHELLRRFILHLRIHDFRQNGARGNGNDPAALRGKFQRFGLGVIDQQDLGKAVGQIGVAICVYGGSAATFLSSQ